MQYNDRSLTVTSSHIRRRIQLTTFLLFVLGALFFTPVVPAHASVPSCSPIFLTLQSKTVGKTKVYLISGDSLAKIKKMPGVCRSWSYEETMKGSHYVTTYRESFYVDGELMAFKETVIKEVTISRSWGGR